MDLSVNTARSRTLTESGTEQYELQLGKLIAEEEKAWTAIESLIVELDNLPTDFRSLRAFKNNFVASRLRFLDSSESVIAFLHRQRTDEATSQELVSAERLKRRRLLLTGVNDRLEEALLESAEVLSKASVRSHSKRSVSSELSRKRAQAETEKATLEFLQEELRLKQEKAKIEDQLKILDQSKKSAMAEAEVRVLENASDDASSRQFVTDLPDGLIDHQHKVAQYINSLSLQEDLQTIDRTGPCSFNTSPPVAPRKKPVVENSMSAMSNFLLRKDLLLSRLSNFNDQPESYRAWKMNFKSVIEELNINAFEEMQLLIRWLGPESSQSAADIRQGNIEYPERGVKLLWDRLEDRFGRVEYIHSSLKEKIVSFQSITLNEPKRLYKLLDLLTQVDSLKQNPSFCAAFSYFDTSIGLQDIVCKLPFQWREKWIIKASEYKELHDVPHAPFAIFVKFIQDLCRIRNDPGLQFKTDKNDSKTKDVSSVQTKKTEVDPKPPSSEQKTPTSNTVHKTATKRTEKCPMDHAFGNAHNIKDCRKFRSLPISERRKTIKDKKLCYRCCGSHLARNCNTNVSCEVCASTDHVTALHTENKKVLNEDVLPNSTPVVNRCTLVCGNQVYGKSCAKTLLTSVYPVGQREKSVRAYVIIDDQSSKTLAKSSLFDAFHLDCESIVYSLSSCSGQVTLQGRRATNIVVEPIGNGKPIHLSAVIECDDIPTCKEEISTPDVAKHFPHLFDLQSEILDIDHQADILILIGRDHPDAHHVLDQRLGPSGTPFAQRLPLGWAIIGECCLGKVHMPKPLIVNKTQVLDSGQGTVFTPCPNYSRVVEHQHSVDYLQNDVAKESKIFQRTKEDNLPGMSIEDREFMSIMDQECHKSSDGHWVAPLPFRTNRMRLPNNREQVMRRTMSLMTSLKRDHVKKEQAIAFMDKLFKSNHAEEAPDLKENEECWYLPIFPVFHPKKPTQIRMVFDSSASHQGQSLNSSLLPGPDLTNSLIGILLRFRKERIGFIGDIEQMFHSFKIHEKHRNFVRFIWFEDNDPGKALRDFRMCVHLFGNSPSPAVATYCLRKCVETSPQDVWEFVNRNFYVDDGLSSRNSEEEAIELLSRTKECLQAGGQVRFHKFASNSQVVMESVLPEDRAKTLKDVHLDFESAPLQRSLGVNWNLPSDSFVYTFEQKDTSMTKRGILSCVNSLYDPLGFISPVIMAGRFIFRELTNLPLEWDEPIPTDIQIRWKSWWTSLHHLQDIQIPRTYVPVSLQDSDLIEFHAFSDASEKAISAVIYLRVWSKRGAHVGFLIGKSKLAPLHGHTIPRLELCAALIASELVGFVQRHLDIPIGSVTFYTDSRVVLGYIYNKTRRFHTYISNRVQRILSNSSPEQWVHISSGNNPADIGSRSISASELRNSQWLRGPDCLQSDQLSSEEVTYPLLDPDNDSEIKKSIPVFKTEVKRSIGSQRFERFSRWDRLIRAFSTLRAAARRRCGLEPLSPARLFRESEIFIVKEIQSEFYGPEICSLINKKPLPKGSALRQLDPYLQDGVIRVGGRIRNGDAISGSNGPIILPRKSHITRLLVEYHHQRVKHQGRHLTEGAIRTAGYWVLGAKRLISSILNSCVICRKLRRKLETQKMSDIPAYRCTPAPQFSYVGVDAFGPWEVASRTTRGGSSKSKRWAILFTCLTCRAVHIELVDEISSAAFINALRRFISIRGKVTEFHSDRGTNFVGSTDSLGITAINVESNSVRNFLMENGSAWIFNPPHASHMGGVWERVIVTARRILDSIIMESKRKLTHDVLNTFMFEACSIINSRPLANVSVDPSQPSVLSPSALLTQKTDIDVGPFENIDIQDMYKSSWQHTQLLANQFWKRWKQQYLHSLQARRKWTNNKPDLKVNDVVLLKDNDSVRYEWPMGVVERVFPSSDKKVRKVEIRTTKKGQSVSYVRPVTEAVLLFSP